MENLVVKLNDWQFAEMNNLAQLLTNQFKIEKIICFGVLYSYKKNNTCFIAPYQETKNFYFLMVITMESVKIDYMIQDFVNKRLSSDFLLVHRIKDIIKAINQQNRFFLNIFRNGAIIYTTAKHNDT